MSLLVVGFCVAALIALPGFLPFLIADPEPPTSPWFHAPRPDRQRDLGRRADTRTQMEHSSSTGPRRNRWRNVPAPGHCVSLWCGRNGRHVDPRG